MTPKDWTDFVRIIYSGPAAGDATHTMRGRYQQGDPRVDKVEFEREYCRVDFDLDARDEIGQRVQQLRVEEVERLLRAVFDAGVNEGRRQIQTMLRETIGARGL